MQCFLLQLVCEEYHQKMVYHNDQKKKVSLTEEERESGGGGVSVCVCVGGGVTKGRLGFTLHDQPCNGSNTPEVVGRKESDQ